MGPQKCRVCDEALSKYKCPSCLAPYCSLGCFKRHKEVPCVKPLSPEKETSLVTELPSDQPLRVDAPDCIIQQAQLESLASSSDIREALKDKGLRELIKKIDTSADAECELDKAMEMEDFHLFSEKILSAIAQDKEAA
ncbi:hypothetical protein MLD38_021694 [Melastoma candidum]|uniref:Uncharacterized protein n=1 Tax=Melastoma candidum TaxID=119954 RepID=A0ACB9QH38_9MYRT|nr:hypothetical protein MLD38_021694 [Melastoma candidum]